VSDVGGFELSMQTVPDGLQREWCGMPLIPAHAEFNVGKGLQVLCRRVEFPLAGGTGIIRDHRISRADAAMPVKGPEPPGPFFFQSIDSLHKRQNVFLPVEMRRDSRPDGNDLAQMMTLIGE
jgi:hypothetical protein